MLCKRSLKRFALVFFGGLVMAAAATVYCDSKVRDAARGKLYSDTTAIPNRKTGLLLGTVRSLPNGKPNPYYTARIRAAVDLLRSGHIRFLVISGDNGRAGYDEPSDMRADIMREGIDSGRLFLDYAGFRTFDSMVRLRTIFGQREVVVISQEFHNERALFIAQREGIDAIGFNARDLPGRDGLRMQVREKLARVNMFLDYLVRRKPRYGGKPVSLPG
ncbi:MAG: hypothetical protein JWP27_1921 [Flaviaesturariibacter sp.]|nr:hypothetical protein [Flaviaesturariibacter sp.]